MKTKSDIKTIEKFLETQNEYRHIEANLIQYNI